MRLAPLVALSLAAASPSLAQSDSLVHPVTVPFGTNRDAMVILPATLGEGIRASLILDTGAGLDVLAPSLIRRANGTRTGAFAAFRMTGERVDLPLFVIPELTVGPVTRRNVVAATWDVLDSLKVDGIVSMADYRQQPITIDFAGKSVTFETAGSLAVRRATGSSIPLRVDDLRGIALDFFARFSLGGHTGDCEVDTGSQITTVSTRYLVPLGVDTMGAEVVRKEGRTIAGAKAVSFYTTLQQVSLVEAPGVALSNPRVAFSNIIYDCVIGVDFWAGRSLTIDLEHRILSVARSP